MGHKIPRKTEIPDQVYSFRYHDSLPTLPSNVAHMQSLAHSCRCLSFRIIFHTSHDPRTIPLRLLVKLLLSLVSSLERGVLLGHISASFETRALEKSEEPVLEDGELFQLDARAVFGRCQ